MALADAIRKAPVVRRRCRICREPIILTVDAKGKPVVESCSCRELNRRYIVPITWTQVEQLTPVTT